MSDVCRSGLVVRSGWEPGEPLWRRVPTHGEDGRSLSDFMMIIPDLNRRSAAYRGSVIARIHGVLDAYRHAVVFADLNLRLNVLWVSVRPIPGMCLELPTALKRRVPEAMLVANRAEAMMSLAGG